MNKDLLSISKSKTHFKQLLKVCYSNSQFQLTLDREKDIWKWGNVKSTTLTTSMTLTLVIIHSALLRLVEFWTDKVLPPNNLLLYPSNKSLQTFQTNSWPWIYFIRLRIETNISLTSQEFLLCHSICLNKWDQIQYQHL